MSVLIIICTTSRHRLASSHRDAERSGIGEYTKFAVVALQLFAVLDYARQGDSALSSVPLRTVFLLGILYRWEQCEKEGGHLQSSLRAG